jgi:hypothetical protein
MTSTPQRREACRRLTGLMKSIRPFSFLRLGDGELAFMLNVQEGIAIQRRDLKASVNIAYDGPGIDQRHYERVRTSYEECTYLDLHDRFSFNAENLPRLRWERREGLYQNESPETSMLVYDWTNTEFHDYIRGRRCLFAGAEAALLRELYSDPEYRKLASAFWPDNAEPVFHQVRGDGENLSDHLDAIKDDIAAIIRDQQIDTLFLSLGGAAKPICHELSRELNVCAMDFGSMMRGLAYCGTSGAGLWRSSHNPFFVRVPFAMHMQALERAHPNPGPVKLLAKAHAQLCLDLQRREAGWSLASDVIDLSSFDPSPENLRVFHSALRHYQKHYRPLAHDNPEAQALVREFDEWCLKKGLGWRGKIFRGLLYMRNALRPKRRTPFSKS